MAAVTNTSKFTRFSTSGGGQLYGYEPGVDGQYKVDQFMFETAFKYKFMEKKIKLVNHKVQNTQNSPIV